MTRIREEEDLVMSCHVISSCHVVMSCHLVMSCRHVISSCHVMSSPHVMSSCHLVMSSRHVMSCYHVMSCRHVSHAVMSSCQKTSHKYKQELSYRKQIVRQLHRQCLEGIYMPKYYTMTLKYRLRVTQDHWKRNHWTDHTLY